MTMQASEAFGLFLTALRNAGVDLPLNDRAVAAVLSGALEEATLSLAGRERFETTAESLRLEFQLMVDEHLLTDDNGASN